MLSYSMSVVEYLHNAFSSVCTLIEVLAADAIVPEGSGLEIAGGVVSPAAVTVKVWLGLEGRLVCDAASVHLTWTE